VDAAAASSSWFKCLIRAYRHTSGHNPHSPWWISSIRGTGGTLRGGFPASWCNLCTNRRHGSSSNRLSKTWNPGEFQSANVEGRPRSSSSSCSRGGRFSRAERRVSVRYTAMTSLETASYVQQTFPDSTPRVQLSASSLLPYSIWGFASSIGTWEQAGLAFSNAPYFEKGTARTSQDSGFVPGTQPHPN